MLLLHSIPHSHIQHFPKQYLNLTKSNDTDEIMPVVQRKHVSLEFLIKTLQKCMLLHELRLFKSLSYLWSYRTNRSTSALGDVHVLLVRLSFIG